MHNDDDNAALPLENNDKINYRLLYADRIAELEAEIVTRRLDYTEDCKRLDARIADLEQQLAAMTAERDSESRWAKKYSDEAEELRHQPAAE